MHITADKGEIVQISCAQVPFENLGAADGSMAALFVDLDRDLLDLQQTCSASEPSGAAAGAPLACRPDLC